MKTPASTTEASSRSACAAAVVLACFALSCGASYAQSLAVPPPAESLDLDLKPPPKIQLQGKDSRQQTPVTTHAVNAKPEDAANERQKPQDTKPSSPATKPSQQAATAAGTPSGSIPEPNEGTVDRDRTEPPAPAAVPPSPPASLTARDFARSGGGSLLNRTPPTFAPAGNSTLPPSVSQGLTLDGDIEPCEMLVMSKDMDEARDVRRRLSGASVAIRRRFALAHLGAVLSVFCVPVPDEVEETARTLARQYPSLLVTLNDRYRLAGDRDYFIQSVGWRDRLGTCTASRRIGLIDTGVDLDHPAFAGVRLTSKSMLSAGRPAAGSEHGTAVASVLAGSPGLAGAADLTTVNVFRKRGERIDTDAELLVRAIDWLLGRGVELINMSLEGPPNAVLDFAVKSAAAAGVSIIAAGGNGERNPAYPAAYPEVIAVTAVDSASRIYTHAAHGSYIDFAAPGVDLYLPAPGGRSKYYTGTSFAAPFVTAALAVLKTEYPSVGTAGLKRLLASGVRDLGDTGRDRIFGWGLIQAPSDCTRVAGEP